MARPIFVKFDTPKEVALLAYDAVELARDAGKVSKGTNEVTKLIERGEAKMVVMAEDVQPPEILAHIPLLCEEKKIPYAYVPSQEELGKAAGLKVSTASCAIVDVGKAKAQVEDLSAKIGGLKS